MYIVQVLLFSMLSLASHLCSSASVESDENTLVLVHVIFRHGDRTPNLAEVYPKDPYINYTYPPFGFSQLTEAGKKKEFLIGKSLRERYNRYLENVTSTQIVATTTDYSRTKLSCQLVLAGLHSVQNQDEVNVLQNSECLYKKRENDQVLGDPAIYCPGFKELYHEQETQLLGLEIYSSNKDFYEYILNSTGWTTKGPKISSEVYYILKSQESLGFKLPDWTHGIWPEKLSFRAADEYFVYLGTTKMRRISSGYALKKILDTTESLIQGRPGSTKKLYLYSGHDFNLAFLLILLEQFKPHIPPFGAYITFEVHNINGTYGFKIFYENYSSDLKRNPFDLKGCGTFCPLEKFRELFFRYLPVSGECDIL